jgi:hypothetical protein
MNDSASALTRLRAAIDEVLTRVANGGHTPWGAAGRRPGAQARRAYLRALRPYMRRRGEIDLALVDALRAAEHELARVARQLARAEGELGAVHASAAEGIGLAKGARDDATRALERARRAEGALALHQLETATVSHGALDAVVCTVVSRATIGHAFALGNSVARVHPGTPVLAVITDGHPLDEPLPFVPVSLEEVVGHDAMAWRRRHPGVALEYALTPAAIRHVIERTGRPAVFIKQESMVVGSLRPLLGCLGDASIGLTPHFLAPPGGADAGERTRDVLLAGTFNGGVVVASGSEGSRRALAWWEDRTRAECTKQVLRGRHFEQRWLDLLAASFDDVAVIRDPGANVGHWNIADRVITGGPGHLTADGHPIAVLRFSGFDPDDPDVVTRYAPHRLAGAVGPLADHFAAFRHELLTHRAGAS